MRTNHVTKESAPAVGAEAVSVTRYCRVAKTRRAAVRAPRPPLPRSRRSLCSPEEKRPESFAAQEACWRQERAQAQAQTQGARPFGAQAEGRGGNACEA
ncbi:hypothetical protein ACFSHP_26570 [Novosphingobium panipatense]